MSFLMKASLFVLLSLVDLSLTFLLLNFGGGGGIGEANPAARWFLDVHGWMGMATFKAITVVMVLGACSLLSRWRPLLAGRVLTGCSMVVSVVVLWSCLLTGYLGIMSSTITFEEEVVAVEEELSPEMETMEATEEMDQARVLGLRQSLVLSMMEGRYTLARAVQELEGTLLRDQETLEVLLARYPQRSELECYALLLAEDVATQLMRQPEEASRVARRLIAELKTYCRAEDAPELLKQLARYGRRGADQAAETSTWSTPAGSSTTLIGG